MTILYWFEDTKLVANSVNSYFNAIFSVVPIDSIFSMKSAIGVSLYIICSIGLMIFSTVIFIFANIVLILLLQGLLFHVFTEGKWKGKISYRVSHFLLICSCNKVIKAWQYFLVITVPFIIFGLIPLIYALITRVAYIAFIIGVLNCAVLFAGVLTIDLSLLKYKPKYVLDNPERVGFFEVCNG